MRPLIGITAGTDDERNMATCTLTYINSVLAAGGKPVLIPVMPNDAAEEMLSVVDGLLFPGGVDVDPRHYNERPNLHMGRINPALDFVELHLARKALAQNMPMLGICRGCQLVTVAAGGGLVQDVPTQIGGAMKHQQMAPRWHGTHEALFDEDSLVARVYGTRRVWVNSFHHQSMKSPGDSFTITGRAIDGVSEAAETKKGFRLLLQWHPEGMWEKDPVHLEPFKALVRAAKGEEV
ncbi:MAG: gamma-glutamyl-gamma-aminobutyrate hydrolase family protein [Bacillota bacterium]